MDDGIGTDRQAGAALQGWASVGKGESSLNR